MKVSVLMGGTSAERGVSLKTGKAVVNACLELGYEATPVDFNGEYSSILNDLKSYASIDFRDGWFDNAFSWLCDPKSGK